MLNILCAADYSLLVSTLLYIVLLYSCLLLELNIYWLLYPNIVYHLLNHISIHLILTTLLLFNYYTIAYILLLFIYSIYHNYVTQLLCLYIYYVIISLYYVSLSIIIHLYLSLLYDLLYHLTLCIYQYMLYIHLIWIWGHIEVYIIIIPNLCLLLSCIISCCNYCLYDTHTIIISLFNIAILSIITWVHHIYLINM